MKYLGLRVSSAILLAGLAWPAALSAQESPRPPAAPAATGGWEVNWGEQNCMLIRNSGAGGGGRAFVLRRVPGSGPTDLITIDPSPSSDLAPGRAEPRRISSC